MGDLFRHYTRRDGTTLDGPGIQDLAATEAPAEAKKLDGLMQDTLAKMQVMKDRADSGKEAYDQMIGSGNSEGNAIVQGAIDGLIAQTRGIEALVTAMKLSIKVEGSDSLDNPSAVNAQLISDAALFLGIRSRDSLQRRQRAAQAFLQIDGRLPAQQAARQRDVRQRRRGSSFGRGRSSIREPVLTIAITRSASSRTVKSPGLPRLTGESGPCSRSIRRRMPSIRSST